MRTATQVIENALAGIRNELANHQAGTGTVSTPEQLRRFEMQLTDMLDDLRQGRFSIQRTGLGRIVADSWPLDHELANRICAAAQAYERSEK